MKFYLAPVAAVLFRARYTRVPQRVYFLWHPQALAVADRLCSYARLTQCRAIPRSCGQRTGLRVYIVFGRGNPPVVARFDADAAPVAALRNCQKNLEARPGAPPVSIGLSAF